MYLSSLYISQISNIPYTENIPNTSSVTNLQHLKDFKHSIQDITLHPYLQIFDLYDVQVMSCMIFVWDVWNVCLQVENLYGMSRFVSQDYKLKIFHKEMLKICRVINICQYDIVQKKQIQYIYEI